MEKLSQNIIHSFPLYIEEPSKPFKHGIKPQRIKDKMFDTIKTYKFQKWLNGQNPITERNIKINGRIHRKVGRDLGYNMIDKKVIIMNNREIRLYKEKTKCLFEEWEKEVEKWEKEVEEWEKEVEKVKSYNESINSTILKIKNLQDWNEYILFDGKKNGLPPVHNKIHRENDCMGNIVEYYYRECRCHNCEDWGGRSCNGEATQYYKCSGCDYTYSEYTSKGGGGMFWWK
jgi:hypothetical protein